MALSIRVLIVGWRILIEVLPWMPWEVAIRIEYLTLFFSVFFYLHFIYNAFKEQSNALLIKVVSYFYIGLILLVLLTPVRIFSHAILPNNVFMLVLILYALYVYIVALRQKVFGAGWVLLSYFLFLGTVGMALLDYANLMNFSSIIISIGFISFVFSMSLIFASRFGKAFYQVEELKTKAENQNELILEKTEEISEQHNLIKDSIRYAKRIQSALLPDVNIMSQHLKDSFVFYRPQNVVSGDFYWFKHLEETNEAILVIADCTGHGVPGAFMSIVGINSLDKIITNQPSLSPSEILVEMNDDIRLKFSTTVNDEKLQDGMDIIICRINLLNNELVFASALHKLVLIRDGIPKLLSGSRHFIGTELKEGFTFDEVTLNLLRGDQVFMFSDGVYDQKGGEKGKKMYYNRFEESLVKITALQVEEQQEALQNEINEWMGSKEQLDDMLVFGWKIP